MLLGESYLGTIFLIDCILHLCSTLKNESEGKKCLHLGYTMLVYGQSNCESTYRAYEKLLIT